jgi:hypothetical protein
MWQPMIEDDWCGSTVSWLHLWGIFYSTPAAAIDGGVLWTGKRICFAVMTFVYWPFALQQGLMQGNKTLKIAHKVICLWCFVIEHLFARRPWNEFMLQKNLSQDLKTLCIHFSVVGKM